MKRVLLCVALLALVLVPTGAEAAHGGTIHPGDPMQTGNELCTFGFVAHGEGQTYLMTAAHCVDGAGGVGADVRIEGGPVIGDVAAVGNPNSTASDWALIDVRPAFDGEVRASVRGHPGFPRGTATPSETAMLDIVRYSGWGVPFFIAAPLREQRVGLLGYHDAEIWDSIGPDLWGDSGGPVIHDASQQAIGLVSRLCYGACTSEGPTVQGIIAKAAAKGFTISLATV